MANPGFLELDLDEHGPVSSMFFSIAMLDYLPEAMHQDLLKEAPAIWIPRLHNTCGFRTEKETPVPQI